MLLLFSFLDLKEGGTVKTEEEENKRGTKRSYDYQSGNDNKRSRQDDDYITVEDEPQIDKSVQALDWCK